MRTYINQVQSNAVNKRWWTTIKIIKTIQWLVADCDLVLENCIELQLHNNVVSARWQENSRKIAAIRRATVVSIVTKVVVIRDLSLLGDFPS